MAQKPVSVAVVDVPQPPNDTAQDFSWFWTGPTAHPLLAAASWDGTVRVWEVRTKSPLNNQPLQAKLAQDPVPAISEIVAGPVFNNGSPTLCCAFLTEMLLTSGTMDGKVLIHNIQTSQTQQIGSHDVVVRRVFFWQSKQLICSVGIDGSVKFWNFNQPGAPVAQAKVDATVANADLSDTVLIIAGEDRQIHLIDLGGSLAVKSCAFTHFKYPFTSVKLFPNNDGFLIGSCEGRCRIQHFEVRAAPNDRDFNFRTCRIVETPSSDAQTKVYSVNAVEFNPIYNTLITAGGDGHATTWDMDARLKVQEIVVAKAAIIAANFDKSGRLLAVSLGYDWSMGVSGRNPNDANQRPRVGVISLTDAMIRKNPPSTTNSYFNTSQYKGY